MNATSWLQGLRAVKTQEGLQALGARVPRYVSIALALALSAQAAIIVTDFAGSFHPSSSALLAGPAPAPGGGRRTLDIPGLANAHLFGTAPAPGASSTDDGQAPATRLALVLAGVLAADDPAHGLAILGEAVTNARVYAVGQNVPGGARLHAVYEDRVILDRDGAFESLVLPRGAAGGPRGRPAPLLGATPAVNPLETMRRVINDNPGVVGEIFRPTPVFANGKQEGFRVYPGRNRAAFSHLGLQPGDLVTAVNGTPLDDPARGNEILGTLSSSAEARVTLTRNGRSQDLVLNLAQVAAEAEQTLATPGARAPELPMPAGAGSAAAAPGADTAPAPNPEAANPTANAAAATPLPAATPPNPEPASGAEATPGAAPAPSPPAAATVTAP
jgi:general secretion pathway protein C